MLEAAPPVVEAEAPSTAAGLRELASERVRAALLASDGAPDRAVPAVPVLPSQLHSQLHSM